LECGEHKGDLEEDQKQRKREEGDGA